MMGVNCCITRQISVTVLNLILFIFVFLFSIFNVGSSEYMIRVYYFRLISDRSRVEVEVRSGGRSYNMLYIRMDFMINKIILIVDF